MKAGKDGSYRRNARVNTISLFRTDIVGSQYRAGLDWSGTQAARNALISAGSRWLVLAVRLAAFDPARPPTWNLSNFCSGVHLSAFCPIFTCASKGLNKPLRCRCTPNRHALACWWTCHMRRVANVLPYHTGKLPSSDLMRLFLPSACSF